MNRLATLLLVLLLFPLGAQATCIYSSGGNTNVVFSLPSTISVPANTPNGATLATTGQVSPDNPPTIDCGYYNSAGKFKISAEYVYYGVVNPIGGTLGDGYTFSTGVPGIGFRITHPTDYLTVLGDPKNTALVRSTTFSVTSGLELVKTGPITSGSQLPGGRLADWQWGSLIPETFRLANTVTFITPSCDVSTDPTNVVLPPVSTGAFTGVGATSGTTPFHISLSCSGGMAVTQITMHTASPDSHTGVIQPSGNGYAAGIGVRVLDNGMNPVTFETPLAISPGATTSIPFYAQYFQTAAAVSGGNVKATVTFDIYYQ